MFYLPWITLCTTFSFFLLLSPGITSGDLRRLILLPATAQNGSHGDAWEEGPLDETYLRHHNSSCTLVCILLHFLHSYSGPSGIVKKVSPSIFFSRSVFCIFSFRLSEKTTATLYFPKSRGGSEILRGRPDLHFANQKSMIVRYQVVIYLIIT